MNNSDSQAEHNPTRRLLELIRSKGQSGAGNDQAIDPSVVDSEPATPRLFTPKSFPQLGIEISEGQIKIVGSMITKGQPRLFLCQMHDFPYDLQSEDFAGKLKNVLTNALGHTTGLKNQGLQIWANYEFSREEFHVLTLPLIKKKDLPAALDWSLKRQLDVDVQDSILDFEILGQVVENNVPKYQVLAVLLAKEEIARLQESFVRAGYPLSGITPTAQAILNLFRSQCLTPAVPHLGVMHIGRQSSRIIIFSHQRLLLHRKIRTGSLTLLEEASEVPMTSGLESTGEGADRKSREDILLDLLLSPDNEQTADQSAEILSAIEPGMDRLIRQVERTLAYHTRNLGHEPVQRIYLCGKLAALPQVQTQIFRTLDLDVQLLDAFGGNIALSIPQPASLAQRLNLSNSLGVSLSKQDWTLNFLHTFAHKARDKKMLQARVAGIVCVTLLLCLLGGYHLWQSFHLNSQKTVFRDYQKQAQQLENRLQKLKARIGEVQTGQEAQTPEQILRLIETKYGYWQEYAARFKPVAYLSEIFTLLPDNTRIQNIYAYLQDKGPKVSLSLEGEQNTSTERVLYSDPQSGITLRQAQPRNSPTHGSFENLLLVKGRTTGWKHSKHVLLSQLTERIGESPFFQVWDSIGQEILSPSSGPCIEFHLLLKATEL
ncbi:MAG: hypothetical protein KGY41_01200 [Desulfovermiculus sp.]|nr:hypothetical protein [Desulfovermiculus sp.]